MKLAKLQKKKKEKDTFQPCSLCQKKIPKLKMQLNLFKNTCKVLFKKYPSTNEKVSQLSLHLKKLTNISIDPNFISIFSRTKIKPEL